MSILARFLNRNAQIYLFVKVLVYYVVHTEIVKMFCVFIQAWNLGKSTLN